MKITKDMIRTDLPVEKQLRGKYGNCVLALYSNSIYDESNLYIPKWGVSNVSYYLKHPEEFEGWVELEDLTPRIERIKMTLFLRTEKGKTVVDCEIISNSDGSLNDFHCSVDILQYSIILLEQYIKVNYDNFKIIRMIKDFSDIDELRGYVFEVLEIKKDVKVDGKLNFQKVKTEVEKILKDVGEKYNLYYVED